MELYEYLAIGLTLFYTASLPHLAGGLTTVIKKDKVYSVHVLSIVTTFLYTLIGFWSTWAYHTVEWTLWKFLFASLEPAFYYFIAAILIPNDALAVESWRDYFYENKNKFYTIMLLLLINIQVSGYFLLGLDPLSTSQIPALFAIIPLTIALRSKNHMVHMVIMILYLIQAVNMMSTIAAQPGWLLKP